MLITRICMVVQYQSNLSLQSLASRDLILDSQEFRESNLESSFENFEDQESSFESRN